MSSAKKAKQAVKLPVKTKNTLAMRLGLVPRMSEKAYNESSKHNTYIFMVPLKANKVSIAAAIEAQYSVSVLSIKTAILKGKPKKSYQKRNKPIDGNRIDYKKAFVRLADQDSIDIFKDNESNDKQSKESTKSKKESK